ncbi:hypothetical protein GDO78_002667 [Eleutherodactylus coqui]|uniref:Uncharacterized protein n=1 Tax=Eleutherodactylus coqui TaxID=57060 RepID=A0A8J6K6P2_ELECQ|nr:hypothetical protein GDO78_002667 [Eleutherodactylus coqui]
MGFCGDFSSVELQKAAYGHLESMPFAKSAPYCKDLQTALYISVSWTPVNRASGRLGVTSTQPLTFLCFEFVFRFLSSHPCNMELTDTY